MKRFDAVAAGCLPTWLRSRIFVEVLIKQTKAAGAVNTKFCEFDGRDGEGGVYLNLKECLPPVCDYLAVVADSQCGVTQSEVGSRFRVTIAR